MDDFYDYFDYTYSEEPIYNTVNADNYSTPYVSSGVPCNYGARALTLNESRKNEDQYTKRLYA